VYGVSEGLLVVKFGGSVLRSLEGFEQASRKVKSLIDEGYSLIVVVSAVKGATDSLLRFRELGVEGVVNSVYKRYKSLLDSARLPRDIWEWAASEYGRLFSDLARVLWAVSILGESSPRVRDYIVSFGERFSAVLLTAMLRSLGIESEWLLGGDAGIVTDDNYGEANPLHEVSERLSRERLLPLINKGMVPVVTGFVASTIDGSVTLLGRGGSDLTATLLARYLNAVEVRLYTDVPGIMSGDPRMIPGAKIVERLSYAEAIELSRLGLRKFHPRTFEPLLDTDIPVRVTNIPNDPKGSLITREGGGAPVKAVTVLESLALITVRGPSMVGRVGFMAEASSLLASEGVNIVAVTQPPSETNIAFLVSGEDSQRAYRALSKLKSRGLVSSVDIVEGVSAVSVIGDGVFDPDVASRVYSASRGLFMHMIYGHPSPVVTFITEKDAAWPLARRLHEEVVARWRAG
jgi:aspartate kinase